MKTSSSHPHRRTVTVNQLLPLIAAITLLFSSCDGKYMNIRGNISGVESDTLLFRLTDLNTRKLIRTDTVALKNGHFKFHVPDSSLFIHFSPKPSDEKKAVKINRAHSILFFPGDRIKVEGTSDDIKISGSQLYDDLEKFNGTKEFEEKIAVLNQEFTKAYQEKNKAEQNRIRKEINIQYQYITTSWLENIRLNPNSIASGYQSTKMDPENGLKAIGMLSDEVKNGPLGELIRKTQESYKKSIAIKKQRENIHVGKPAPDFKLRTDDEKEISLADFKGKYLLIDFWGSWCGWCIKGFPDMKAYYKKYRRKVEFLGVCCNDTRKNWTESLEKYELPWVNAFDDKTDITIKYAISGFPTKILVDPKGQIAGIFVGESPALYKFLDNMFK